MKRTITMTFEADDVEFARAEAVVFSIQITPFGRCIAVSGGPNPMCEAERPDEFRAWRMRLAGRNER